MCGMSHMTDEEGNKNVDEKLKKSILLDWREFREESVLYCCEEKSDLSMRNK